MALPFCLTKSDIAGAFSPSTKYFIWRGSNLNQELQTGSCDRKSRFPPWSLPGRFSPKYPLICETGPWRYCGNHRRRGFCVWGISGCFCLWYALRKKFCSSRQHFGFASNFFNGECRGKCVSATFTALFISGSSPSYDIQERPVMISTDMTAKTPWDAFSQLQIWICVDLEPENPASRNSNRFGSFFAAAKNCRHSGRAKTLAPVQPGFSAKASNSAEYGENSSVGRVEDVFLSFSFTGTIKTVGTIQFVLSITISNIIWVCPRPLIRQKNIDEIIYFQNNNAFQKSTFSGRGQRPSGFAWRSAHAILSQLSPPRERI